VIIKCCKFEKMSLDIKKQHKGIIMFGTGVIGSITSPEVLNSYDLLDSICCYVDNDKSKWGMEIEVCGRKYEIYSPQIINDKSNFVILLNISRYDPVVSQLKGMDIPEDTECYIMPMLCIHNFQNTVDINAKDNIHKIPKTIHYMWLGQNEIPVSLRRCIDSWKRYCPDYEIKCWNESNYNIEKIPYMKQAYDNKEYGFVPDYARLDILFHYGGIYLDTDVELIKPLDDLLGLDAFCCVEKWQTINLGGGSGAVKGNQILKKMLEKRRNIEFIRKDGTLNKLTCGYYDTKILQECGYTISGDTQTLNGMTVLSYDFFHPYDYMSACTNITENTYGIHHFNGGWLDDDARNANKKTAANFKTMYEIAIENGR